MSSAMSVPQLGNYTDGNGVKRMAADCALLTWPAQLLTLVHNPWVRPVRYTRTATATSVIAHDVPPLCTADIAMTEGEWRIVVVSVCHCGLAARCSTRVTVKHTSAGSIASSPCLAVVTAVIGVHRSVRLRAISNRPSCEGYGIRACRKASHAACVRLRTPSLVSAFFKWLRIVSSPRPSACSNVTGLSTR